MTHSKARKIAHYQFRHSRPAGKVSIGVPGELEEPLAYVILRTKAWVEG